jgi:NTP pyrophosphohydrolases including oxidative damage repair enzymes
MVMNKEFSAGAVIFRKEQGRVLFLVIFSNRNRVWGFPKGHIEPNETEHAAALREIAEETGLLALEIISGFREEAVYEAISKRGQFKGQRIEKHSIYFLMETRQAKITVDNDEIGDYKWLELNEALSLVDFGSGKNILRKVDEFLKS